MASNTRSRPGNILWSTFGKALAGNGRLRGGQTLADVNADYDNPLTAWADMMLAQARFKQLMNEQPPTSFSAMYRDKKTGGDDGQ